MKEVLLTPVEVVNRDGKQLWPCPRCEQFKNDSDEELCSDCIEEAHHGEDGGFIFACPICTTRHTRGLPVCFNCLRRLDGLFRLGFTIDKIIQGREELRVHVEGVFRGHARRKQVEDGLQYCKDRRTALERADKEWRRTRAVDRWERERERERVIQSKEQATGESNDTMVTDAGTESRDRLCNDASDGPPAPLCEALESAP